MAVTPKGIYYPSTPSAQADLITDLQQMAETTDTAIGNVQIPIDSALSPTSENPVQNKVIYTALEAKEDISNKSNTIDNSTTKYPSNKAVYDLVGDLESILTTLDIGSGV